MAKFIISLGSSHNLGPVYFLKTLKELLTKRNLIVKCQSRIYKNAAQNTKFNRLFFNRVICLETNYQPLALYRELKQIEQKLGRIRTYTYAPRTIDIDILMSLDFSYCTSNFFMPHRNTFYRNFFVIPAIEAIRMARWQLPLSLLQARSKFGLQYLCGL